MLEVSMIDDLDDLEVEPAKPEPVKKAPEVKPQVKQAQQTPKSLTSKPTVSDEFQIFKELEGIDLDDEVANEVGEINWSTVS